MVLIIFNMNRIVSDVKFFKKIKILSVDCLIEKKKLKNLGSDGMSAFVYLDHIMFM